MRISVDLPAPFGPQQPEDLAGLDGEADAVDGGEVAEPLDDVLVTSMVLGHCRRRTRVTGATRRWSCRPPDGGRALSRRSRISNVLMSRLVRLTSRCVAKPASARAVEHGALALVARGQSHRQRVALLDACRCRSPRRPRAPRDCPGRSASAPAARACTTSPGCAARTSTMPLIGRVDLGVARAARRPWRAARWPRTAARWSDSLASSDRHLFGVGSASATAAFCASICWRATPTRLRATSCAVVA